MRERCDRLLASCYAKALALAREKELASIAFPAISTGVYRFPAERAAKIAVGTVKAADRKRSRHPWPRHLLLFFASGERAIWRAFKASGLELSLPG